MVQLIKGTEERERESMPEDDDGDGNDCSSREDEKMIVRSDVPLLLLSFFCAFDSSLRMPVYPWWRIGRYPRDWLSRPQGRRCAHLIQCVHAD